MKKNIPKSAGKVFFVCSGLGHIQRGYESFTRECYDALSGEKDLDIILFKGSGKKNCREIPLPCIKRRSLLAYVLSKLVRRDTYRLEQLTFTLFLLPYLHFHHPNVVYFSDEMIGIYLFRWRKISKLEFQLVFSNGAPLPPPYPCWDHVQQVTPNYYSEALSNGELEHKQSLLPYGFQISQELEKLSYQEAQEQRHILKLPQERFMILSIGALNKSHKRVDYLIKEIALLPKPLPFLVLLGQREEETNEIEKIAEERLGQENFVIRSVPHEQTALYYQIADLFVLASLSEGFGRVLVEAMAFGLPCLVHDYAIPRYVLADMGYFGNFEKAGGLSSALCALMSNYPEIDKDAIHRSVYERFSWVKMQPGYVKMLHNCAKPPQS